MNPLTQEQSATLLSFAEQRDVLQKQVSDLTKEKDTLLSVNKELTTSNSALVVEIEKNKTIASNLTEVLLVDVVKAAQNKAETERQTAIATQELESVKRETGEAVKTLSGIKAILSDIGSSTKTVSDDLRAIGGKMNVYLTAIKEASEDIVASSTNVKNASETFADKISKEYQAAAKRQSDIDKEKIMLNGRETAINALVEDYKKKLPPQP